MFIKSQTGTQLDAEIQSALEELKIHDKTSEKYGDLVDHIAKLHKLKTEERFKLISPDTVLVVAANIFGILWITRYEREHAITTKSLGFILRPNR